MIKLFSSIILALFFAGCGAEDKQACPQCHMAIEEGSPYACSSGKLHFDEFGCMVLYADKNGLDLASLMVKTKDTLKAIPATKAHYSRVDKTPMSYGFAAYEETKEGFVSFDEAQKMMLRGEHMANPKIKKQLLGDR